MFGYVIPGLDGLPEGERGRYREAYCGLCRAIGARCGQRCRLALSYDMAFMALVLGSLYEPAERVGRGRCALHPARPRAFAQTDATDYAADLTVVLAYHKCLDDWHDDRSAKARAAAAALAGPYRAVRRRLPGQCAAIEAAMADIAAIEQAGRAQAAAAAAGASGGVAAEPPDADAAANRFGVLLGDLFAAWRDDYWADGLRRFGARLGKLVYLMDAAVDFDDDAASGSYNPFVAIGASRQGMREGLEAVAGATADAFERLPLERDVHLLRSVLYEGIWQRLNAQDAKRAEKAGAGGGAQGRAERTTERPEGNR